MERNWTPTTAAEHAAVSSVCRRILALVNAGMAVRDAYDAVLGAGAYSKLVGELYDELRARSAKVVA